MITTYVIQAGQDPTPHFARAEIFKIGVSIGDPSGLVTAYPSIVVTSPALATQVIRDDAGQANFTEVGNAQTNATNAENSKSTQEAATLSNLESLVTGMSSQLTQGTADLATLASGTADLATVTTIVSRILQGSLELAQGLSDVMDVLNLLPKV
jgi:hypothetical protein